MPIDQIDKVTIAVSADADHPVRTAIKGTEDEMNKLVADINKVFAQLEALVMTRTRETP
jgi:hypothetical protein